MHISEFSDQTECIYGWEFSLNPEKLYMIQLTPQILNGYSKGLEQEAKENKRRKYKQQS